jgi:3-dehydroquinate synthase
MNAAIDTVRVALDQRSYDVKIGAGLLETAGAAILAVRPAKRVFVVTDATVAALHLARLEAGLKAAGLRHETFVQPPGETSKDWAHLGTLLDAILAHRPERGDILLALGGGVIGDMTGVAAALLLRGVDFVQCPTTLLAQVDSSVGGKTAVNTRHGKNLVGAFHQPRLVLCDLGTLDTLPARELRAGYAETVKYGLIDDPEFFAWCEANAAAVLSGAGDARRTAVRAAVAAKARIVAADERESGVRALLNLGHTFGHALEAETGFGSDLLHGEAVAIGMRQAFDFSAKLGLCAAAQAARVASHLDATGLPTRLDTPPHSNRGFTASTLIDHMGHDKKVRDGKLTFILVRGIGQAFVASDVDGAALRGFMTAEAGR